MAVPAGCHHGKFSKLRIRDHYGAQTCPCPVLWRRGAHSILRWWRIHTVLRWWRIHTVLRWWRIHTVLKWRGFHPILCRVKSTWGETIMVGQCCPRDRDLYLGCIRSPGNYHSSEVPSLPSCSHRKIWVSKHYKSSLTEIIHRGGYLSTQAVCRYKPFIVIMTFGRLFLPIIRQTKDKENVKQYWTFLVIYKNTDKT